MTTSRQVILHGDLARFGRRTELDITVPADAICALAAQIDGFAAVLRRGRYRMLAGQNADDTVRLRALSGLEIHKPFDAPFLHIQPVISGAARDDGKMLLGLTLLGLSFVPGLQAAPEGLAAAGAGGAAGGTAGGAAGLFGSRLLGGAATWLILTGASDALAPQTRHPAGQTPSAAIGATPPSGEGTPIPLVYGRARITNAPVASAGLSVTTLPPS